MTAGEHARGGRPEPTTDEARALSITTELRVAEVTFRAMEALGVTRPMHDSRPATSDGMVMTPYGESIGTTERLRS